MRAMKPYIVSGKDVFCVGIGNGFFAEKLLRNRNRVTGIEIDKDAARQCEKNCPSAKIICEDFLIYSPSSKYDVVYCLEVLEHLDDDTAALKKMRRMLKENGELILSVPIGRIGKAEKIVCAHHRHYTERSIIGLVEKSGFRIISRKIFGSRLHKFAINVIQKSGLISRWKTALVRLLSLPLVPLIIVFVLLEEKFFPLKSQITVRAARK